MHPEGVEVVGRALRRLLLEALVVDVMGEEQRRRARASLLRASLFLLHLAVMTAFWLIESEQQL
jgi:hypothetical protein